MKEEEEIEDENEDEDEEQKKEEEDEKNEEMGGLIFCFNFPQHDMFTIRRRGDRDQTSLVYALQFAGISTPTLCLTGSHFISTYHIPPFSFSQNLA